MIRVVPTRSGESVTTHAYDVLFEMVGPEGPQVYRLAFHYNVRMGRWILSIFDAAGRQVVSGAPVVQLVDLLAYAAPGLRPRGSLICVWKTEALSAPEPGERDLGAWSEIIYLERIQDLEDLGPITPGFA